MNSILTRFGMWLLSQATWRSVVRVSGLGGMMYMVLTEQHPDATALMAMGAMIGLASFISLVPTSPFDKKDKDKDE